MSKEISCYRCHTINAPGSKFCSNCGERLQPGTSRFCPKCDASNSIDRLYCDSCGTRLDRPSQQESEDAPVLPDDEQEDMFTLPIREPGDTGELDPAKSVPDWLRGVIETGGSHTEDTTNHPLADKDSPESKKDDSGKKSTGDLPDWLVNDQESEPIIEVSSTIPSDQYLDLIQEAEDEEPSDAEDQPKADIPDWLTELASPVDQGEVTSTEDQSTPSKALTDWLTSLSESDDTDDDLATLSVPTGELPAEVEAGQFDDDDLGRDFDDWFSESNLPESDPTVSEREVSSEQPIIESEMLDWLAETLPKTDTLPDLEETAVEEPVAEDLFAEEDFLPAAEASSERPSTPEEQPVTSDPLPDWLADPEPDETIIAENPDITQTFTGLFVPEDATKADLDWLEEIGAVGDKESLPEEPEPEMVELVGGSDWLSELEALGEEALAGEDIQEKQERIEDEEDTAVLPEAEADIFDADWPEEDQEAASEMVSDPESSLEESDWIAADTMLADALQDELPDWLDELGPPVSASTTEEEEEEVIRPSEGLPEWIADMKPGSLQTMTGLSSPLGLPDQAEPLPDLSDELAEAKLPNWLEGAADMPEAAELSPDESPGMPEWLGQEEGSRVGDEGIFDFGSQPTDESSELATLLQELPPAKSAEEALVDADIPEWILSLKPRELTGDEPEPELDDLVQEIGPLTGIRNVIDIEPVITQSGGNGALQVFSVTNEQKAQAALLKQLAMTERAIAITVSPTRAAATGWLRVLLAGLLLIGVLVGLLRPALLPRATLSAPLHVTQSYAAVQEAAGQPVLLAIEYTPGMAGELNAQAETLLSQLADNGSPILTVSQYTAGTAVAEALIGSQPSLGLVTGESAGLRQLGDCLSGSQNCATIGGRSLIGSTQQTLADVGLIIVLTGERDSLINWIEQVGRPADVPMLAVVTQSLGPIASPYFDSGQLGGVVAGMPETAVYQQIFMGLPTDFVNQQLGAQTLAQLLAVLILIAGGLWYGLAGENSGGNSKKR